jgi:hypothetical protein
MHALKHQGPLWAQGYGGPCGWCPGLHLQGSKRILYSAMPRLEHEPSEVYLFGAHPGAR